MSSPQPRKRWFKISFRRFNKETANEDEKARYAKLCEECLILMRNNMIEVSDVQGTAPNVFAIEVVDQDDQDEERPSGDYAMFLLESHLRDEIEKMVITGKGVDNLLNGFSGSLSS